MSTSSPTLPRGIYVLDPVHSTFGFAVKHNGVSTFRGHFERVNAQLEDGVLTGTAEVESIKTAIPDLLAHLTSPEFFNAADTPTVEFRSTDIRTEADGSVEVDGELTIRGTTQSVTAKGTFAVGDGLRGRVAGFDLTAVVDRRLFGLNWQAPLPSGGEALGWDVILEARLELAEAEGQA